MFSVKIKLIGLLVVIAAMAGCGEKVGNQDSSECVIATVGDVEILSTYYEERLALIEEDELPRDEDGNHYNMLTDAGKLKFIDILVNKELMVLAARSQGYAERQETVSAYNALLAKEASELLWAALDATPLQEATDADVEAMIGLLGVERTCYFLITNHLEDAEAAREMAIGGAAWDDVVAKYHAGSRPKEDGPLEVNIPFGRYNEEFDTMVYGVEVGEVSEPVDSGTGFWLVKVISENIGEQPSRTDGEAMIKELVKRRAMVKRRNAYRKKVDTAHNMFINEEALLLAFNGLPVGETTMDPNTNKPLTSEALEPMVLDSAHDGMIFFSYEIDGEVFDTTLGEYRAWFDHANVFVRPKSTGMLGGMRGKIIQDMEKPIMDDQARLDGYYDDPAALETVKGRIDQIVTMALFKESVIVNEEITDQDRADFWVDHSGDYSVPEARVGFQVICLNKDLAVEAAEMAAKEDSWDVVMDKYNTDEQNKASRGAFQVAENDNTPLKEIAFALSAEGDVSAPYSVGTGKYAVARLEKIHARRTDVDMSEVLESVDGRILGMRQEAAFLDFLAALKAKYPVVIKEENLAGLKGWKELYTARIAAEGMVQ